MADDRWGGRVDRHQRDERDVRSRGDEAKLFVGNISNNVTEGELSDLFKRYGRIVKIDYKVEKGFAFITFENSEEANKAITVRPIYLVGTSQFSNGFPFCSIWVTLNLMIRISALSYLMSRWDLCLRFCDRNDSSMQLCTAGWLPAESL